MARRRDKTDDVEVRPIVAVAAQAEQEGLRREGDRQVPLGPKAKATRDRLLTAAYEQFSETGYRGTKVADICERAGTSLGTFYQYFQGRADVMTTLVADWIRGTMERPPWTLDQGTDGVRRILRDYIDTYVASAPFQGVWEEATHVDEIPAAVRRDLSRLMTEGVEREVRRAKRAGSLAPDVDPSLLARALTSAVDRYCYLTYVFDPPEKAVSVDESVEVLTHVWTSTLGVRAEA